MGIVVAFLKEQRKALLKLEEKLDNIIESLKEMQDDIRYLRGKTVLQLIEMRKKRVEDNMNNIEILSVYVDLRTLEKKFDKESK